jgi:hypothetical protein
MVAPADENEARALVRYVAEHLVETADDGRCEWQLEPEITVPWAFLAWDKPRGRRLTRR